ncbi:MAG: peptidylprolyl isomerase [Bryobacteraceae bacterium]
MFNLFRSKGRGVKLMLGGLLFMVALSMLLYLVPNYTDPNQLTGDPVVLQVGSTKLKLSEAQNEFQQSVAGRGVPAEMMAVYFPQYIESRKLSFAATEVARRMGITATDDEVLEVVMGAQDFAPFFKDGKLIRRTEFEAALAARGGTPDMLFSQIRDQIMTVKLQDVIAESTVVTPKELEDEYKRKYERATVDYVSFTERDLRSAVALSDGDIQKQYEANKSQYQQPEKYGFRVVVLSQDSVAANLKISDAELRAQYAAAIENFRSPEQVHARHILLGFDGKSDADKKAILAKAEGLVKQARGGADFAELAKKNSEDSGNASLGGDLGTFGRGQMDKAFEDAAFALKANEVSGVVTSKFGYHIIQVVEKIPSKVTPFENVKADLEKELRASKVAETMATAKTQLHDELVKFPVGAAEVAKKFNAELVTVSEGSRGDAIPTLGVTPEIDGILPGLKAGAVTDAITIPGDRAAVVLMDKLIPGRPSTLDEAKAAIREALTTTGAAKLLADRSKEAAERIRKGENLQAVGKALGGQVDGATNFGITDSIPGIGPAAFLKEAFSKGVGTVIGPMNVQGRTLIVKVVAKTEAEMAGLAAERSTLLAGLKGARAQQTNQLWMDSMVKKLTDNGDIVVNDAAVKQMVSQISR